MASTNKTTNYELSQYIGTDKPTYLGDYNGDMLKIDTQMKANADAISTANTTANTANTTANTASTNASSALETAVSASTTANTANSTANSALAKAVNNESAIANFNLTTFNTITTFTKQGAGNFGGGNEINVANNTDGSLAKIYGQVTLTGVNNSSSNKGKVTFSTVLRPTSDITIVGGLLTASIDSNSGATLNIGIDSYTIKTNGDIEFEYYNKWGTASISWRALFINSLVYVKDFGDTPVTPE